MFVRKLIITTIVLGIMLPVFFVNAGTILSSYKYAWSNNSGYINFENVVVDKDILSGYAWSANHGWIKFNPTQGGVFNDGEGNLSGFAWGEQLGWIDFNGVKINTNGKFTGNATGTLAGIVNFDCPNYCDVRTDWAQATTTPIVTPVTPDTQSNNRSSSSGSRLNLPQSIPLIVESKNAPLIVLPQQSGILIKDAVAGAISIEVPANNFIDQTTIVVNEIKLSSINDYLVISKTKLVNEYFYDISAFDYSGNMIHSFSKPIKISLPISDKQIKENNSQLYWLNEVNWKWVLIPDAVFAKNQVTFNVNHLTRFAIFSFDKNSSIKEITGENQIQNQSIPLPLEKKTKIITTKDDSIELMKVKENGIGTLLTFIGIMFILIVIISLLKTGRRNM